MATIRAGQVCAEKIEASPIRYGQNAELQRMLARIIV
jgi:hypothetical protein